MDRAVDARRSLHSGASQPAGDMQKNEVPPSQPQGDTTGPRVPAHAVAAETRLGLRLGASRLRSTLEVGAVTLVIVALAESLVRSGVVSRDVLPTPSAIILSLAEQLQTSDFWSVLLKTAIPWAAGLGVATAVAIPVGVLLGLSPAVYRATYLTVEIFRTTPTIAALPLMVLLYGVGYQFTIILVAWTSTWPLLIQTMYGVRDVDPVTMDTAKVYGLKRHRRITGVVLPSAVPFVATGMRISAVMAFVVAVAASLLVGGGGLGFAILSAANAGQLEVMWARITVTGLIGLALTIGLRGVEARLLRWRPSTETTP